MKEINIKLRKDIVKGEVADFAITKAQLEDINIEDLAIILREIADGLTHPHE